MKKICKDTIHVFFILLLYEACSPPIHRPVQRLYFLPAKHVEVLSADSAKPVSDKSIPVKVSARRASIPAGKYQATERKLTRKQRSSVIVARSNKPLVVTLQVDSMQKMVLLQPHRDLLAYLNMKFVFRSKDTPAVYKYKGWTYRRRNLLTLTDTSVIVSRFAVLEKGMWKVDIAAGFSSFGIRTDKGSYNSAGIAGVAAGISYYYHNNRFVSVNAGAATDVLPVDHFGPYETVSNVYGSVRNNIVLGRFDLGYGLSWQHFTWKYFSLDSLLPVHTVRSTTAGFSCSIGFTVINNMRMAVVYQPALLNISHPGLYGYQHYLFYHIAWSFPQNRHRQKRSRTR